MRRKARVIAPDAQGGCPGCQGLSGRRAFLTDLAGGVTGALLWLGLSPRSAQAIPIVAGVGERAGSTIRYPIPASDQVVVDEKNEVIVVRRGSSVYAFALACPHQNTALRWHQNVDQFICPKHKSRYRPDGAFIAGRATRNMDRLPISRDGDAVLVNAGSAFRSDDDQAGWSGAVVVLP